ncbi:MAG: glycosyl hydrolase [Deltaproteobacteria bacterium]|nr:glycosyl hydrolase [Deltaproteobacteria bacterium]
MVWLAAVLALLLVGNLVFVWWIGAWGILFPSEAHDTTPPEIAADFGVDSRVRVLVYSKTNSFRHTEGIAAAHALLDEIGARRDWAVFHSENGALFSKDLLDRFDVVVFANASGNHASDEQDEAFRTWLEDGGGWVGIHAAGDGSHAAWTWYGDNLITGKYLGHIMGPQTQEARVVVEDRDHPITRGLPVEFRHEEEWYSWDRGAREAGFDVLLTIDESSYEPWIRAFGKEVDISMGEHPVVWSRCLERGRAVYTAMGHWGAAYDQDYTKQLLENAVEWAAGNACADAVAARANRP